MEYFGYAGSILHVNLTTKRIRKEPLDLEIARKFIGGMGINQRLIYDYLKPNTAPFLPENPIIFGTGPLTGTLAPLTSKVSLTAKVAARGSKSEQRYCVSTGFGGSKRFGAMLKNAGYDHLVITGRADRPCYLKIIDDDIEICDASDLWGKKDLLETSDTLTDRHKIAAIKCGVWAIGKGGENLVTWSHGLVDGLYSLGRFTAAVAGSKNLKAIATLGTKGIKVADGKQFMALVNEVHQEGRDRPELIRITNSYFETGGGAITEDYPVEAYTKTKGIATACFSCIAGCRFGHRIRDGRFEGEGIRRIVFAELRDYGRRLKIKDYRETMKLLDIMNRLGLCNLTGHRLLYFVTRLFERGVISKSDTGGLELKLGDFDTYVKLLEKVVNREDIGAVAAGGWYDLAEQFGVDPSADFKDGCGIVKGGDVNFDARLVGIKTLTFPGVIRPTRGQEIFATDYHPAGEDISKDSYWPEFKLTIPETIRGCKKMALTDEEMGRIFFAPFDFNGARLGRHAEDTEAVCDCLGACASGYHFGWPNRDIYRLAKYYSLATGLNTTPRQLKESGERVWNLERLLNFREGFTREDDAFPDVWLQNIETPIRLRTGELYLHDWRGRRLTRKDLYTMLDDYYDERGWDKTTGIPTRQKLAELGLEEFEDAAL